MVQEIKKEDLEEVRNILKAHKKDAYDYEIGIREAQDYLRNHVEREPV